MEINATVALKYDSLQPTHLQFQLEEGNQSIYVTPQTRCVRLDFYSFDTWDYAAQIFDDQVNFFKRVKRKMYLAEVPLFSEQPIIGWKKETLEEIDLGEHASIDGLCSQAEYKKVYVNGRMHDLEFNIQGNKLVTSLNLPTLAGAPKRLLYSVTLGPRGAGFLRVSEGDYQTLQQIVDLSVMGITNLSAENAPKLRDLIWRERPFIDPGYDQFILDLC